MKRISTYYALVALLALVILGFFFAPLLEAHLQKGTLLPSEDKGEQLQLFAFWFRFCFSFFAALAFWGITDYVSSKSGDQDSRSHHKLCIYLTLAMTIFALNSLINIGNVFIPGINFEENPVPRGFISVLSTINSYFILVALSYFDFGKTNNRAFWLPIEKFITVLSKTLSKDGIQWRRALAVLTSVVIVIDITLLILYPEKANVEKTANITLSFITCLFLGLILFSAFWQRGSYKLAWLSVLTSITIFLAQLTVLDFFPQTPVHPIMKLFFSLYYTAAFVAMIFALELSYLGSSILEKANDELARQKKEYQGFTDFVSDVMTPGLIKRFFDIIIEKIKKMFGIHGFDYFFGVAIFDKKRNEVAFPYFEYANPEQAREKKTRFNKEGTFAAICLDNNREVVVLNLNDPDELRRVGVKGRNDKMAGEASSLIYIPMKKPGEEKAFGAITLQNRHTFKDYPKEEVQFLKHIADIFSRIIDPEKILLPPEFSFIRNIQDIGDLPYHFNGITKIRVNPYSEADFLLNWEEEDTDKKFSLKDEEGFYKEDHPFNMMMKGFSQEGTFSCGMILFAAIVAFEQLRTPKDNPFLQKWNEICNGWDGPENWIFPAFFRGVYDKNAKKTEERFAAVFSLIQDLAIRKNGDNGDINVQEINCELAPTVRKIELIFGVNDCETLSKNIDFNKKAVEEGGVGALRHSVASKIVEFDLFLFKGVFTYQVSTEKNSLKLTFKL